jgi:hypothetical protein
MKNNINSKYAIKHKANRYVSGAIGILEVALNGEYILLENLSSNKNVNLKGWFIHRYIPDKHVNIIFKFTTELVLNFGERLRIYSASSSTATTTSFNHNKIQNELNSTNTKVLIANNVQNWGSYSKFSVTKLVNADGVDKAVLTTSLLRLAGAESTRTAIATKSASNLMMIENNQNNNENMKTTKCFLTKSKSNLKDFHANNNTNNNMKEIKNVQTIREY